jgi:hypothetical protein
MDPKTLRECAAEFRRKAKLAQDSWVRDSFHFLADIYEEEAEALERRNPDK